MAGFGLRDIVLAIKLMIDAQSAKQVQAQIQQALNQGTAPATAVNQIQSIGNAIERLQERAKNLLVTFIAVFASRVVYRFVEESVMMFAKFDQKLQQSVAIMGAVGTAMKKDLGDTARAVAKELGISADEIVQGYYYLVSAGLTAQQSIRALPIAATFAKAGLMDMKQATDFLAVSVSALGYASKDPERQMASMARVADVLALASKRSQGTLEELVTALTNKTAQSLRLFHKEVEEGAAALMVLADAGVRGAVAGERLDIFMRQVTTAATKHPEAWKKMGISIFDAAGHMRNFADISHDLTKALGGLTDESLVMAMAQLGIQQRTQASVKVFIGAEEKLREYEAMMAKAGGTTLKISDEMMKTPAERWNQFKEKIADAKREIGEGFLPMIGRMTDMWGDEQNPHSLVGILKQGGEGLEKSDWFLKGLGSTIGWLVKGPLAFLIDALNIIDDIIVSALQVAFGTLTGLMSFFGVMTIIATDALGKLLHFLHLDNAGDAVEDFAKKIDKVTQSIQRLASSSFEAAGRNLSDIGDRVKSWFDQTPGAPPRKIDRKSTGKSGRDGAAGTGKVDDDGEEDKKAAKRLNKQEALDDKLRRMMAKHTKERVDDELLQIDVLEREYKEFYHGKLPQWVREGLDSLRASAKSEGATKAMEEMFKDVFGDSDNIDFEALQNFVNKLVDLKDKAKEGSVEWQKYNELLKKAIELQTKAAEKVGKEAQKKKDAEFDDKAKDAEKRLRKIQRITDHVAEHMGKAFETAFDKLTSGSRRGIDALHALKDVALSALSAPLAEYAMNKAKEQFLEAGNDVAAGFSAMSNPFTAWMAPGYFKAAALHAAQGTAWGALAGGVSAAGSGLMSAAGSVGNYGDHGRDSVDKSTPRGPDINITIDGVDPKNAQHQQLIADTIDEYAQRGGGNLNIKTKR